MKALIATALIAFAFLGSAKADQRDPAVELFMADASVQSQIAQAKADQLHPMKPSSVLLNGSCGFVGCDYTYLVSLPVTTGSVNAQTTAIVAVVKITFGQQSVKLIDLNQTFGL